MEAAQIAFAPPRRVAHQRTPHRDVVGLQIPQHVPICGFATRFLSIGDHVDYPAAPLGRVESSFAAARIASLSV